MDKQTPSKRSCEHCCTRIENLSVRFDCGTALEDINLHLDCGQLLAIVGPNGAGKTTLLRAILGEIPYTGTISCRVRCGTGSRVRIGYVPQRLSVDAGSPISVMDFLALSCYRRPVWACLPGYGRQAIVDNLARVGADHLTGRRIGELSGGELQRVLLALALFPSPDLLLLDEPVSAIDPGGLANFYDIVGSLRKRLDVSILMVTHDLQGIAAVADRLVLIDRKVLMDGTPGEVLSNRQLLSTFGPSLWNLAHWPHCQEPSHKGL